MSSRFINKVAPPALPLARADYDRSYQDQLNNVFRLYFDQLNSVVSNLQSPPVYVVAKLPSAVDAGIGAKSFATDASAPTFGATVVGGGAIPVPVYSDGTNWKVG
jgi:hypothetical protein